MILAFDTYYSENKAKTVCLRFQNWKDEKPIDILSEVCEIHEDYIPGEFYRRELPCILSILNNINLSGIDLIIIDGYVVLDDSGKLGLGGHLYKSLEGRIPVLGVAKTNFAQNKINKREVYRGKSNKPLFITALGTDIDIISGKIKSMHGEYRIPTLLKQLDRITKE